MEFQVNCTEFKVMQRNTLQGFAVLHLPELRLEIRDVAIHEKNGQRWAQLPAKPQVGSDGTVRRDERGKIMYVRLFAWDTREVSDAFSQRAIEAVDRFTGG